jgi:hypothetical protein
MQLEIQKFLCDILDDEIIWSIISRHLPVIKRQVEELLAL